MSLEVSAERQYGEEFGTVMVGMGLPPAYAKVLGWLYICDPPAQSVTEIATAIGQSKGSVSAGARLLETSELIRRTAVPGRRGTFYQMDPDTIMRVVRDGTQYRIMRELLDRGLDLVERAEAVRAGQDPAGQDPAGQDRADRLRRSRDFYAFLEVELPKLIERYESQQHAGAEEDRGEAHD